MDNTQVAETEQSYVQPKNEKFTYWTMEFDVTAAKALIEANTKGIEETELDIDDVVKQIIHTTDKNGKVYYDEKVPDVEMKRGVSMTMGIGIEYDLLPKIPIEGYAIAVQMGNDAEGKPFGGLIIDGWHRIFKCYKQGIKKFPVKVLTPKVARKIVMDPKHRTKFFSVK